MTGYTGRYIGLFALLCLCAAVMVTVLLWSPTQARQAAAGTSASATSVIAEVEQAALSGPARTGSSNGTGFVQFGDSAPIGGFQPTAPYYATFYYPWYGAPAVDGHWSYWTGQNSQPPATWFSHYLPDPQPGKFDPSQELYSSDDPAVLYWQFAKMAEAKIEVAISSWWGKDDRTDDNFGFILKDVMHRSDNPYPNLRWALYYEAESNGNPSAAAIASDLDYIAEQYAGEPAYLKVDGKPVIFVYSEGDNGPELVQRWNQAKLLAKVPFYVVLKVFSGYKDVSPQPDSWHQYGPGTRESKQSPYSYSVSPGFWFDSNGEAPRLPRNLTEFRSAVSRMVAADAVWKLVTTWNEWGEGTAVEPGEQITYDSSAGRDVPDPAGAPFKNVYVDALHALLPPLEAGTGQGLTRAAVPTRTPPRTTPAARSTAVVTDSFSFAVAGDLGGASKATASFEALANLAPPADFFLGIGDMSYDEVKPEAAWCDYVHQHLGDTYPFEILVGNHEEQPSGPNGFIDTFAGCLPDRLGASGLYAHRYYFDYPAGAPLARFILIDPDLYRGATVADYCTGGDTENCDWLKARIDEAKSQGLWTIVSMHKNCLTIGEKSCEIGADLLNMLIDRKVDLVLQGHDHGYQRSKQLSLGAGCAAVAAKAYNAGCVVDDGADGGYTRGAGLVFIISGAFGRSTYAVNTSDPEAGYMASWLLPADDSNGFVQFTVSKDALDGRFVNSRGDFADNIKISASGAPAPPTPTPAATPQPTGCANPAGDMGAAVLTANFPIAANYYVWTRLMSADTAHNAFWLQLDNTCPVQVVGRQPGYWEWINYQQGATDAPILEQLSAGTHTIRLYGIHAGVKVDKLMFTTELNPILPSIPPTSAPKHLFLPQVHS